ncbi:MAG: TOBE domain-containing protein [Deltaproteobacteria bacterium]|jgi:molybdate transport system regulatory protein|nr:TOBE domain-containing protein [Deltaproteobacteria bacterium]
MKAQLASFLDRANADELTLLLYETEKRLLRLGRNELSDAPRQEKPSEEGEGPPQLDAEALERLDSAYAAWMNEAAAPGRRRSRGRIWLAFALIRYGALRLNELFALDDRRDIDCPRNLLRVGGPYARTVQMPAELMRQIASLLDDPAFYSLRGEILRIDPGYLRRKFYELAARCALPGEVSNPRALRQARGMELLNGGVPLKAVWSFMGRRVRGWTDGSVEPQTEIAQRIVRQYLNRELKMKTSARNVFVGKITRIVRDSLLAEVEFATLSGLKLTAVITGESLDSLGLAEGRPVTGMVKAPWVILAEAEDNLKVSARNRFSGQVSELKHSEIAAEALITLRDGSQVCALITKDSAQNLKLAPGREIMVMFKAFSVILSTE